MGVYHLYINETKKEYISPGYNGRSIKQGGAYASEMALTLVFAMGNDWYGDHVRVITDSAEEDLYADIQESSDWKNVSKKSFEAWSKMFPKVSVTWET